MVPTYKYPFTAEAQRTPRQRREKKREEKRRRDNAPHISSSSSLFPLLFSYHNLLFTLRCLCVLCASAVNGTLLTEIF